jgi:salicylate hydroxylase
MRLDRSGDRLIPAATENGRVASSRTIIIAGAGIGGLVTALALAKKGFRAAVIEQSGRLEEIGAGIQLSPNATRVLLSLGLGETLKPHIVAPENIRVRKASSTRVLVRVPLGGYAERRYGAPYWMIHRGDLQAVLLDAVRNNPAITLSLGTKVEDYAVHPNGITVQARCGPEAADERGIALVGADGLWSSVRTRLGHTTPLSFRRRVAWRAVVPAEAVPNEFREPSIHLWLGRNAHLVHYPVKAGTQINIVAIVREESAEPGWSNVGVRAEILARFGRAWAVPARNMVATPDHWAKWALYDRPPSPQWGKGPVTLVGDAAHPMLPFLAQGAAMAVEDAAVLAECLANSPDAPADALRAYERLRYRRTAKVQRAARGNDMRYHSSGSEAVLRNLALRLMGGKLLLRRYDWLYGWRPKAHDTL